MLLFPVMFIEYIIRLPRELSEQIETLKLSPNNLIISQNGNPDSLYLVLKGSVRVYHLNERGQEFLFGLFGSGEFFGELEFFTQINYFSSVETITETTLLRFSKSVFENILQQEPGLYRVFCFTLANRLLKISERVTESSYFPLEVLLAKFFNNEMKDTGSSELKINKEDLAGYFGTNLRSINRIIKKFADSGILAIEGNRLSITDSEKLKKVFKQY